MVYTPHEIVKPEKLAATAVGLLERSLVVPSLMARKTFDEYRGAKGDTLNMIVPGVLPARKYGWRNDRTNPLVLDQYKDRKIAVTMGGDAYSFVALTDEQKDMDFQGWGTLLAAQNRAIAAQVEYDAVDTVRTATYSFELGAREDQLLKDIVEGRRILNALNIPTTERFLLVGSDIDAIMQLDDRFNLASNIGDAGASSALQDATIGKVKGFTIVQSDDIASDEFYMFDGSAFALLNAAPSVPDSIKAGGTSSLNGLAVRWMRDYSADYLTDRSLVNTWYGFQSVTDPIVYWDSAGQREVVSESEYLVRGIKGKLGGADKFMPGTGDAKKVRDALGVAGRSPATVHSALPVTP